MRAIDFARARSLSDVPLSVVGFARFVFVSALGFCSVFRVVKCFKCGFLFVLVSD